MPNLCPSGTAHRVFEAIMMALNFETLTKEEILAKVVAKGEKRQKNGVIVLF